MVNVRVRAAQGCFLVWGSLDQVPVANLYMRPSILNDGTIAVLSDDAIVLYDEQLNETGEIPLPSGTGDEYTRPSLIDANDNLALFVGTELYIIDRDGNVITSRIFGSEVREVRLGPDHLFVALDTEIYRFGA